MKILFVCLGNICRSPAAEAIMQQLIGDRLDISCDSAGTSSHHLGELPDKRMHAALEKRGYPHRSRSRQVKSQDFYDFDLILAMDHDNHRNLQRICPDPQLLSKLKLMCEYCEQHQMDEVPDPYFGGLNGFTQVIDLLEDACLGLWKSLQRS
ncbi:MAG: low molecular weight protein-tyrosine-phosphatase [Oligoflexus sp.]